jgi:hypothetical protein
VHLVVGLGRRVGVVVIMVVIVVVVMVIAAHPIVSSQWS